ncbi:reverse transcriptase domain-containing protein [Tanacetum coccineum]
MTWEVVGASVVTRETGLDCGSLIRVPAEWNQWGEGGFRGDGGLLLCLSGMSDGTVMDGRRGRVSSNGWGIREGLGRGVGGTTKLFVDLSSQKVGVFCSDVMERKCVLWGGDLGVIWGGSGDEHDWRVCGIEKHMFMDCSLQCMRTHSQSRNLNCQQQQAPPGFIEPFNLEEPIENLDPPVVTMADNRTMTQLLEAPTEGYRGCHRCSRTEITAEQALSLEHGLLTLVQNKQFFRHDKEDPHAHIRYFNKITSTMKFPNVPSTLVKLMLFPFSLEGAARIWLEKEPPRFDSNYGMILFCEMSASSSTLGISPDVAELKDMVKAILLDKKNQNQAPAPTVEESCVTCGGAHYYRNCPATDGNVYRDNIQEYVYQAAAANFNQGNTSYRALIANQIRPPGFPLVQQNQGNNQNHYNQNRGNNYNQAPTYQPPVNQGQIYRPPINQTPVPQASPYQAPAPQTQGVSKDDFQSYIKANDAVMRNMQNQTQNMQNQMTNLTDLLTKFMNSNTASTSGSGSLPSNIVANPKSDLKAITTRSGVSYQGPTIPTTSSSPPRVVERETKVTKDTVPPTNNGSTKDVQPPVVQVQPHAPNSKPVVAPVSAPMPNPKLSIPYPSRRNDERRREKANDQIEKLYKIFKDLSFEISLTDALILMPKFASTLKALIRNKEKLSEMARTLLNEHCSAVILNKLPEKLGDPGKFLIPCDFPGMDECLALADLGASINLMPLSVWKKLSLSELTPTCMTLELADLLDFDVDPRVPLVLGSSFLKTGCALIDVYEGELTLRLGKEAEYSQEVLGFSDMIASGNPTFYYDPIDSTSSPTLTTFGDSDFLLEEVDVFLALKDDPTSPEVDDSYYDPEGDILLLKSFLNDDPSPPPNQGNYLPEICKELKVCVAKTDKSSINEPPEIELKDLPPHLEYSFLEGDNKLPVLIAKDLSIVEKTALIKVLKSHKRAITWKLSDIKGINPEFCSHKILMEEDYKLAVQHQRRVNPKIYDVIKKEVEKLLNAGLIYPISDSPWVSPVHCVQKKSGFTVVENDENELILT